MNFPLNRRESGLEPHGLRPRPVMSPAEDDEAFDIHGKLLAVWQRKWLVLLATVIGVAISVFAAASVDKRYTASARVLFEPERVRIIDLDSVVVSPDQTTTGLQNQVEILRSATLLERVADILRLNKSPEFNPALVPLPPTLLERAVARLGLPQPILNRLADFGLVRPAEPQNLTPEEQAERLRARMLDVLGSNLRLRPLPNSRVIDISYSSGDPVVAANVANAVGEQYIVVQAERKGDAIAAASETLSVRVRDLENRLAAAEEAVRVAQLELTIDSKYGTTLITKQLEALNASLSEARFQRSSLEEQHQRVAEAVADPGRYALVPEFRESQGISGYMASERQILEEIAGIRAIVADEQNPQLIRLNARLDRVRGNMRLEAENVEKSLAMAIEAANAREAALEEELSRLEDRAVEHARSEMRISRLEREAEAARVIYETFLNRLQETREQANLQTADASFLTKAAIPLVADNASRLRTVAIGSFAGLAVGIGLAFLLDRLNRGFREPDEIQSATGLPVLASIPMTGSRKRPRRLIRQALRTSDNALAESVRNLRTSLLLHTTDYTPRTIMFASSLPGEGKTTTAMLMAALSRQMGRSTLIVDCDLRRRTLAKGLDGAVAGEGLLAVLDGKATLGQAIKVDRETGVHFLALEANERMPKNPADLLSSRRFRDLVEELKDVYDLILFDTPPVLAVTDARVVAQFMDAIVYMVAWKATAKNAVSHGLRELASVNAKVVGVVLTLVSESRASYQVKNRFYYTRANRGYIS
jgi:polysaccharide biosynthesis transport protein